jgi:uncharacterized membrane protein (GlpM family)
MYDGPQAWLVRRNILIACVALVPTFLVILAYISALVGGAAALVGAIAVLMLMPIAGFPYFAAFPLLLACVYLRLLLRSGEVPPWVKKRTLLFVTGALALMLITVGFLYFQYRSGGFKI